MTASIHLGAEIQGNVCIVREDGKTREVFVDHYMTREIMKRSIL